jgi:hypothetical protein
MVVGALIALSDGTDVLGIFATNGWTKLVMGAGGAALILLSILPRVGRRRAEAPVATARASPSRASRTTGRWRRTASWRTAARGLPSSPGPPHLWQQFDTAAARLNDAILDVSAAELSDAFGELSKAGTDLAEAVEADAPRSA